MAELQGTEYHCKDYYLWPQNCLSNHVSNNAKCERQDHKTETILRRKGNEETGTEFCDEC
jgi:hypothetical protein